MNKERMKYEVQKTKCGGYIVNHQGVDKWVSHAIEELEQSLAETQAKLDKAVEAFEGVKTATDIDEYIEHVNKTLKELKGEV